MRIDGNSNSPTPDITSTSRVDSVGTERSTGRSAQRPAEAGTDTVNLSPGAQLIAGAMRAAQDAPPLRMDLVDKARKAIEAGTLGNDPLRTADRMIDHILGS
jgi:flagellar biosynthesis anti-sigma factor FlgM